MTAEVFQRSPLEGRAEELLRVGAREVPFVAQLAIRSRSPDTIGLPTEPNTWAPLDAAREALWLGPDEWLVVGPPNTVAGFDRSAWRRFRFDDALAEQPDSTDSVVDVSANRVLVDLRSDDGHDRRWLLEQGCSLDLDPRTWRDGRCGQTLLAHVPVILQEREDATRIFVRPSYASWLVDWLLAVST